MLAHVTFPLALNDQLVPKYIESKKVLSNFGLIKHVTCPLNDLVKLYRPSIFLFKTKVKSPTSKNDLKLVYYVCA